MRAAFQARAKQAEDALHFVRMQARIWQGQRGEEMGLEQQEALLRRVWERISVQEAARKNLWSFVRQQTRVGWEENLNRNARLYVGGNGVVPQAAACALLTLHGRLEG
jgi:hypothetical protein